jgi:hypothetical protein
VPSSGYSSIIRRKVGESPETGQPASLWSHSFGFGKSPPVSQDGATNYRIAERGLRCEEVNPAAQSRIRKELAAHVQIIGSLSGSVVFLEPATGHPS